MELMKCIHLLTYNEIENRWEYKIKETKNLNEKSNTIGHRHLIKIHNNLISIFQFNFKRYILSYTNTYAT